MEREAKVYVDGKELPLLPFVERLVAETVGAMIGTLKGGEGAREITVAIKPR